MIIKIPIYLEIEGKFTPSEGQDLTQIARVKVTELFRQKVGGELTFVSDRNIRTVVKILSESQVKNRLTKTTSILSKPGL